MTNVGLYTVYFITAIMFQTYFAMYLGQSVNDNKK